MITRWFIGVKAKSKGYITGFQYYNSWRNQDVEVQAKPTFTKQSALADSFATEAEAISKVNEYRTHAQEELDTRSKKLKDLQNGISKWNGYTNDERIDFAVKHDLTITYTDASRSYNGRPYTTQLGLRNYGGNRTAKDLDKRELHALQNPEWDKMTSTLQKEIQHFESQLNFINNCFVIREEPLELKFKDTERMKIKWEIRGDGDTCNSYCNCCGGAIPSVPQLTIRGKQWINICAICMGKLAEEAKIQMGKVTPEILEHYQTDRFLRSMD